MKMVVHRGDLNSEATSHTLAGNINLASANEAYNNCPDSLPKCRWVATFRLNKPRGWVRHAFEVVGSQSIIHIDVGK